MHGGVGLLPGSEMATGVAAVGWRDFETVVVADVTGDAGNRRVFVGEGETKRSMVEFSIGPLGDGVALGTSGCIRREAGLDMIGDAAAESRSFVPIGRVAAEAIRGFKSVVVVDMARRARCWSRRHVSADQGEASNAVVKGSGIPALGGMAGRAIRRGKSGSGRSMRRVGGLLPLGEMATGIAAICRADL